MIDIREKEEKFLLQIREVFLEFSWTPKWGRREDLKSFCQSLRPVKNYFILNIFIVKKKISHWDPRATENSPRLLLSLICNFLCFDNSSSILEGTSHMSSKIICSMLLCSIYGRIIFKLLFSDSRKRNLLESSGILNSFQFK